MATNPKNKVYLSLDNLNTLANGGSITSGDDTFTADFNTVYMVPDDERVIKNSMDTPAVAGSVYLLGLQSTVVINMPTNARLGQEILVVFKSGDTAATVTCDLTGFHFVPQPNKTSTIKFMLVTKGATSAEDEWTVEFREG